MHAYTPICRHALHNNNNYKDGAEQGGQQNKNISMKKSFKHKSSVKESI